MKTKSLVLSILFMFPLLSQADILIPKGDIEYRQTEDNVVVTIPFRSDENAPRLEDLVVTLLDENYQPLSKTEKKVVLLSGQQSETIALPFVQHPSALKPAALRIDFLNHIWLKHFTTTTVEHEIHLLGQTRWIAGSKASLRVIVTRSDNSLPVPGASVEIQVKTPQDEVLSRINAVTDDAGTTSFQLDVPENQTGERTLAVDIRSPLGKNHLASTVEVVPGIRIFLTTDKPVYQPGQEMHIRALAAHKTSSVPLADKNVVLQVYDGKGNKVFKKILTTSEFGIVSADFQLADEVNQGEYKIEAALDDEITEKTVQVYEYVLPKFRVDIKTEQKYYAPGDEVTGTVESKYFFGKPVAGARITLVANCFDVGFNEFATTEFETDSQGKGTFSFTIPDRLVGQPQFKGNTVVQMDVRVRDTADHEEQKFHTFHVAVDPIQIEAIPESGKLVPGVENEIFLVASTPDGSVAKPSLTISSRYLSQPLQVQCDENGIASIRLTPQEESVKNPLPHVQNVAPPAAQMPDLQIRATTNGKTVEITQNLEYDPQTSHLLLRIDKGIYKVGESLHLTALSVNTTKGTVFLDIIKNQQTVLTDTLRLTDGKVSTSVPLDHELAGSLTLNAYMIGAGGTMIRDTRQVIVLRSDDLAIEIKPDRSTYQPGQLAQLNIAVTDPQGKPVRTALGLNIVDESVYSLSEKEPGLAKVFFAIERELLQPKIEMHGHPLDQVVRLSARDYQKNANLSKAFLSKLDIFNDYGLNVDTARQKEEKAKQDMQAIRQQLQYQSLPAVTQPVDVAETFLYLQQKPNQAPALDPWGHPYQLVTEQDKKDQQNLFIISNGRDGAFGTEDDIKITNYASPHILYATLPALNAKATQYWFFQDVADKKNKQIDLAFGVPARGVFQPQGQPPGLGFGGMGMAPREVRLRRLGERFKGQQRGRGVEHELAMQIQAGDVEMLADRGNMDGDGVVEKFGRMEAKDAAALAQEQVGFNVVDNLAIVPNLVQEGESRASLYDAYKPDADASQVEIHTMYEKLSAENINGSFNEDLFAGLDQAGVSDNNRLLRLDYKEEKGDQPTGPLALGGQIDEQQLRQAMNDGLGVDDMLEDLKQEINKKDIILGQQLTTLGSSRPNSKSVRVRRYFPETLFYTPELITDDQGMLALNLPMADSITTWRMSAMANAQSGALGDATAALKVFKPFFVDLDLPVALTKDDEVTIPVAVYNYLSEPQDVRIDLERAPWFELLQGSYQRDIHIAANEVTSVTFPIRANELGSQPLTVYAWGSTDNDAIGRTIDVRPNGDAQFITRNGRLTDTVRETVTFPANRVAGADRLFVKIYPGFFSQVVEGLDAILRMPNGCFEQTSSTTYPNIMALQYMIQTGKITPAIEMKAKEYINLGYQRLLTFEIDGGGFEVFGNPPATRILSAYGLMEFSDMSEVYPIDENLIPRTRQWLLGQMNEDGTWSPDQNYAHAEMWGNIQNNSLLSTAYVALALAKTGPAQPLSKTKNYLFDHADEAKDAYTLAILCNALTALDPKHPTTRKSIQRLVDLGTLQNDDMFWKAEASMSFARGKHASVEATAWAILALLEEGRFPKETGKALNWLISRKDPNGTWGTTHGTVLALKALVQSLGKQTELTDATIVVHTNGQETAPIKITPDNSDVFRQLDLSRYATTDTNLVEITLEGEGRLLYQVVGKYFLPWTDKTKTGSQPFSIQVTYDRSELRRNDTVTCQVEATNLLHQRTEMVMIDIGIPPGFRVERPALDELVEDETIAKYSLTPRQLLIYLQSMNPNQTLKLDVPMKATLPMVAKAPQSTIYEYYNPEQKQVSPPQELQVK